MNNMFMIIWKVLNDIVFDLPSKSGDINSIVLLDNFNNCYSQNMYVNNIITVSYTKENNGDL